MRHRLGSILLGVAVTVVGLTAAACSRGPNATARSYGSAAAPQPMARSAYVAPAPRAVAPPAYVAPAPAPQPIAYPSPSHGGATAYLFMMSGCGYCQKLERNTLPDPTVQAELAALNYRRMTRETAEGKALASRYGIGGYPTTVVVDGNGNVIKQIVGYQDPVAYAASLRASRR